MFEMFDKIKQHNRRHVLIAIFFTFPCFLLCNIYIYIYIYIHTKVRYVHTRKAFVSHMNRIHFSLCLYSLSEMRLERTYKGIYSTNQCCKKMKQKTDLGNLQNKANTTSYCVSHVLFMLFLFAHIQVIALQIAVCRNGRLIHSQQFALTTEHTTKERGRGHGSAGDSSKTTNAFVGTTTFLWTDFRLIGVSAFQVFLSSYAQFSSFRFSTQIYKLKIYQTL